MEKGKKRTLRRPSPLLLEPSGSRLPIVPKWPLPSPPPPGPAAAGRSSPAPVAAPPLLSKYDPCKSDRVLVRLKQIPEKWLLNASFVERTSTEEKHKKTIHGGVGSSIPEHRHPSMMQTQNKLLDLNLLPHNDSLRSIGDNALVPADTYSDKEKNTDNGVLADTNSDKDKADNGGVLADTIQTRRRRLTMVVFRCRTQTSTLHSTASTLLVAALFSTRDG
uniref:Uncharacterized protein n=1 Tax=Leersia perrieri TaxID=77586 RepID=A0A0D9XGW6_9ORYZ